MFIFLCFFLRLLWRRRWRRKQKFFDPHITSQFPNQKIFPIFYVYTNDYLLSSVHTYSKWNFYVIIIISKFKKFEKSVLLLGSIEIWAFLNIWFGKTCAFFYSKKSPSSAIRQFFFAHLYVSRLHSIRPIQKRCSF